MKFATDEEIQAAHRILLNGCKPFDDNRIAIIKNDSSDYIQASPGSGKTTVLLAKLIILANKMPLADGKGVCVLTHTNVAIDEIKSKIGSKADILFRYPNFFGTVQTFLHKYVASSALQYFYQSQISYVDDDIAKISLWKKFNKLVIGKSSLRGYIFRIVQAKEHVLTTEEINVWGGVDTLLDSNVIEKKGKKKIKYIFKLDKYNLINIPNDVRKLIYAKKNEIIQRESKSLIYSIKVNWIDNKVIINKKPINFKSKSAEEFLKLKEELYEEGILSFEDAYDLSFRYIYEKNLDFTTFSNHRFKYVFIDEFQDCDKIQRAFIRKIFNDETVIVQRFGDYCQAIFTDEEYEVENDEILKKDKISYIHNSNRFVDNIARPLRTLCMEDNHLLQGNNDVPSCKPIILTYKDPLHVLPKYGELLRTIFIPEKGNQSILEIANFERENDPFKRINIKACGWVGENSNKNSKTTIESYFPAFKKKSTHIKILASAFDDFILKQRGIEVKEYATSIIQGIITFLGLCEVRNDNKYLTRKSLFDSMNQCNQMDTIFIRKVLEWCRNLTNSKSLEEETKIKKEIYDFIVKSILPLFRKTVTKEAIVFFNEKGKDLEVIKSYENSNIYSEDGLDIEVATVHSVKGETHAATLYMETSFHGKHESEYLGAQFKGISYTGTDKKMDQCLKVIYVGASRPKYLLCVAIGEKRFKNIDCPELREIWEVVEA